MSRITRSSTGRVAQGRRRFAADLDDAKELSTSAAGFGHNGLHVLKLRAGEDDGVFQFSVSRAGQRVLDVNFACSDTSEYPVTHVFYAFSDGDHPSGITEIIEDVPSEPACTISDMIDKFLRKLSRYFDKGKRKREEEQVQASDDEAYSQAQSEDEFEYYDFDDEPYEVTPAKASSVHMPCLQNHFIETVASGYRPGRIQTNVSGNTFVLSVSLPMTTVSTIIPARALMAWDRRLLARSQHLTLLIIGFRGTYPVLQKDGTLTPQARNVSLKFKVGLTPGYKPGKTAAEKAETSMAVKSEPELRIVDDITENGNPTADTWWQNVNGGVFGAANGLAMGPSTSATHNYYTPGMSRWLPNGPAVQDLNANGFGSWNPNGDPPPSDPSAQPTQPTREVEDIPADERFDKFSLSASLESLLDSSFLRLLQFRIAFRLGWAGAEKLLSEVERTQTAPEGIVAAKYDELAAADKEEAFLRHTYDLPEDPLAGRDSDVPVNLLLTSFSYLMRRLTLCTRFCLVCYNPISAEYEVLKPYVCDSKLCAYQYYLMNMGPSLEYEILNNPGTVDLLVSLAYSAAAEGVLEDPLPVGLGLRVPISEHRYIHTQASAFNTRHNPHHTTRVDPGPPPQAGPDGLYDFDSLDPYRMRAVIADLIDSLPSINDMKWYLEKNHKAGKPRPNLKNIDPDVPPAAWSILRWCVGSCTAHLEELTSDEDLIRPVDPSYTQFRFSVGAPDAEAKFKAAVQAAQQGDANAQKYPSLYAFHGSPLRNWHSIIRHGLWFKNIAHGRAYGNGVYFARDNGTSTGYAQGASCVWRNSTTQPRACLAIAEIVNLPDKFTSKSPYFVVQHTDWIVCRYLLVSGNNTANAKALTLPDVPYVDLDPQFPLSLGKTNHPHLAARNASGSGNVKIPEPSHKLNELLSIRQSEFLELDYDEIDNNVFMAEEIQVQVGSKPQGSKEVIVIEDTPSPGPEIEEIPAPNRRPVDDWKHDPMWFNACMAHLLPAPHESSPTAAMAIQRELRAMLKEQEKAKSLRELGWYMPPDGIGDNLFQWVVEVHSFDPTIPIAQDMAARGLNSIVFEIRFPPTYPMTPPFFRIIKPRFLPFIQGGGGHVTGGGSMCMDLLTTDGWLSIYSIPAILIQIKLAISNLEPRPARLDRHWDRPYGMHEAIEGYKRAARTHGWTIPQGIDRLAAGQYY